MNAPDEKSWEDSVDEHRLALTTLMDMAMSGTPDQASIAMLNKATEKASVLLNKNQNPPSADSRRESLASLIEDCRACAEMFDLVRLLEEKEASESFAKSSTEKAKKARKAARDDSHPARVFAASTAERMAREATKFFAERKTEKESSALTEAETLLAEAERLSEEGETRRACSTLSKFHKCETKNKDLLAREAVLKKALREMRAWDEWVATQVLERIEPEIARLVEFAKAKAEGRKTAWNLREQGRLCSQIRKELSSLIKDAETSKRIEKAEKALSEAEKPVADERNRIAAERTANLEKRKALLAGLSEIQTPDGGKADALAMKALGDFRTAWRSLGPVEHTVPKGNLADLLEALRKEEERLANPVRERRSAAEKERVALVDQARQSKDESARRRLSEKWSVAAKACHLGRKKEDELWASFVEALSFARETAKNAEILRAEQERERLSLFEKALAILDERADTDEKVREIVARHDEAWMSAEVNFAGQVPEKMTKVRKKKKADVQAGPRREALKTLCDDLRLGSPKSNPLLPKKVAEALAKERSPFVLDVLVEAEALLGIDGPAEESSIRMLMKTKLLRESMRGEAKEAPERRAAALALDLLSQDGVPGERVSRVLSKIPSDFL